jgi:guanylate kinase
VSLPLSRIVVLSGPSGSGKTTIVNRLLRESPVPLRMSVSATTRPPRKGEVDGVAYYFLTPEEFNRRRAAGEFLECAEVHKSGYWYGTLASEVDRARETGAWSLLEVDVQGAMSVMQRFPDAITIFLKTPNVDEYEQRLRARGTDNDNLDRAVAEICTLLAVEAKSPCTTS